METAAPPDISEAIKGDWIQLLEKDLEFICEEQNDEEILKFSKSDYKDKIKELINKAAFMMFLNLKNSHTKLDDVSSSKVERQPYLKD